MYEFFKEICAKRVVAFIAFATIFSLQTYANITALEFSPASPTEGTIVTVTPTISSVPDGTVYVCWSLYTDVDCTAQIDTITFLNTGVVTPNAVYFTAPNTAGTYYVKCELHTGGACNGIENNSFVEALTITQTSTPTGIKNVDDLQISGVRKELIKGKLYIVRDGKIYDARGIRVE